jgi:hypothetical protein
MDNGVAEQGPVNDGLTRISRETGIPLVVTNDTHFVRREDLETQKHVMSMGMNMTFKEFLRQGLCDGRNLPHYGRRGDVGAFQALRHGADGEHAPDRRAVRARPQFY